MKDTELHASYLGYRYNNASFPVMLKVHTSCTSHVSWKLRGVSYFCQKLALFGFGFLGS
jgi:hypothetical protein